MLKILIQKITATTIQLAGYFINDQKKIKKNVVDCAPEAIPCYKEYHETGLLTLMVWVLNLLAKTMI